MFFSIIIPCYNVEEYVGACIDSVLVQEEKDFEIVLVNDGSKDNTLSVLEEYKKKNSNIRIINQENSGVSSARNKGLLAAKGSYVLFLDADDIYEKGILKKAKEILVNNEYSTLVFGYKEVSEDLKETIRLFSSKKIDNKVLSSTSFLKMYFLKQIRCHLCAVVFKKEVLENNKIFFDINTRRGEDQEFVIKNINLLDSVYYIKTPYYLYRQRKSSVIHELYSRTSREVDDKILHDLITELLPFFYNYISISLVSVLIKVLRRKTTKETVLFAYTYSLVFKKFTLKKSKYSLITFLFIILYKLVLKRKVKNMAIKIKEA